MSQSFAEQWAQDKSNTLHRFPQLGNGGVLQCGECGVRKGSMIRSCVVLCWKRVEKPEGASNQAKKTNKTTNKQGKQRNQPRNSKNQYL